MTQGPPGPHFDLSISPKDDSHGDIYARAPPHPPLSPSSLPFPSLYHALYRRHQERAARGRAGASESHHSPLLELNRRSSSSLRGATSSRIASQHPRRRGSSRQSTQGPRQPLRCWRWSERRDGTGAARPRPASAPPRPAGSPGPRTAPCTGRRHRRPAPPRPSTTAPAHLVQLPRAARMVTAAALHQRHRPVSIVSTTGKPSNAAMLNRAGRSRRPRRRHMCTVRRRRKRSTAMVTHWRRAAGSCRCSLRFVAC